MSLHFCQSVLGPPLFPRNRLLQFICSLGTSTVFYDSIWRMQLQQGSSYNTILSHEFSTRTIEGNQFIAQVTSVYMEDLLRLSLYWRSFKCPCLKQHTYFQKKKCLFEALVFQFFFQSSPKDCIKISYHLLSTLCSRSLFLDSFVGFNPFK